jgi:hypothetical protein
VVAWKARVFISQNETIIVPEFDARDGFRDDGRPEGPMLIGYGRVSTADQKFDLQNDAPTKAGCERIFTDTAGGAGAEQTGLEQALSFTRKGDTVEPPVEQGHGPGAVEEPVGSRPVGRLEPVASLGVAGVVRDGNSPALPGAAAAVLVDPKMLAVGAQEGAESALTPVGGGDHALLQQGSQPAGRSTGAKRRISDECG